MTTCLNEELLTAFLDGTLPSGERAGVESHLVACTYCSSRLVDLARFFRTIEQDPDRVATPGDLLDLARAIPDEDAGARQQDAVATFASRLRAREERRRHGLGSLFGAALGRYFRPAAAALIIVMGAGIGGSLYLQRQLTIAKLFRTGYRDYLASSRVIDRGAFAVWPYTVPVAAESVAVRSAGPSHSERLDSAHSAVMEYLAHRNQDARAHAILGDIYLLNDLSDAAREEYLKAVGLEPENPDWHVNLAVAYAHMGYAELARKELDTALRLAPTSGAAHLDLAVLLHRGGEAEAARFHLERSVELAGDSPVGRKAARWLRDLEDDRTP